MPSRTLRTRHRRPLASAAALAAAAAVLFVPAAVVAADRAPAVTGPVFDAYLETRIAVRQEAPDLDARLSRADDPTPLRRTLEPFLERQGLAFEHFAQAHRVVSRDPGLAGRVDAILDRHVPTSGSGAISPPGGAVRQPPGSDRR